MRFPQLAGFLNKRTPQGQQQAYPGLYQAMPTVPPHLLPQDGKQRQATFNEQQQQMNRGMIGGKLNRRGF